MSDNAPVAPPVSGELYPDRAVHILSAHGSQRGLYDRRIGLISRKSHVADGKGFRPVLIDDPSQLLADLPVSLFPADGNELPVHLFQRMIKPSGMVLKILGGTAFSAAIRFRIVCSVSVLARTHFDHLVVFNEHLEPASDPAEITSCLFPLTHTSDRSLLLNFSCLCRI